MEVDTTNVNDYLSSVISVNISSKKSQLPCIFMKKRCSKQSGVLHCDESSYISRIFGQQVSHRLYVIFNNKNKVQQSCQGR